MPEYTINIPEEAVKFIKDKFGSDVDTYIESRLVRPLMEHYEAHQRKEEMKKIEPQIASKVAKMKKGFKLKHPAKQMDKRESKKLE